MDVDLKTSIDRIRESVDALREAIQAASGGGGDNGSADIHQRLQALARLEQDGLVSEDEYAERKDQMLRDWSC